MAWEEYLTRTTHERHRYFLREAYKAAEELSDDPSTRVGAVLVRKEPDGYQMLLRAANHVPHTVPATNQEVSRRVLDRGWKLENTTHAERAVIARARELDIETRGTTMYLNWTPCTPCAQEMIGAGIARIVGHEALIRKTPDEWHDSTTQALEELAEAGVQRLMYSGEVGGVQHLFRGEAWTP